MQWSDVDARHNKNAKYPWAILKLPFNPGPVHGTSTVTPTSVSFQVTLKPV